MPQLPHEVERMGPELRREVERQLLADLSEYGVSSQGLSIDWSDACQEGHCTESLGGMLEELSSVVVRNPSGDAVADGWMDFVHGGGENPLFVFWLFLSLGTGDERRDVRDEVSIPDHIWQRLPAGTKGLCGHDGKWMHDPKVVAWKRSHAS